MPELTRTVVIMSSSKDVVLKKKNEHSGMGVKRIMWG